MQTLSANSATKIYPPSILTSNKWHVENFDSRKTFAVPEVAIAIIMYCLNPREKESIIGNIVTFYKLSSNTIELLINSLVEKNLISALEDATNPKNNSNLYANEYLKWTTNQWAAAADYHFFTYNYDFLDYKENSAGSRIANERMKTYSNYEPDTNRIKTYPEHSKKIKLVLPFNDSLTDIKENLDLNCDSDIDLDKLSTILGFAFAKTTEAPIRWTGDALIRRTSPSGGSRHPTEGYVFALNIKNLDTGLYHVQSAPFLLTKLATVDPQQIFSLFPEFSDDAKNNCAGIIVMTSIFERNMFRYREPRTFRTIHIDAGHILGTIELITNCMNIKTKITHRFNEKEIEKLLDIDGLSEGVITSIGMYA